MAEEPHADAAVADVGQFFSRYAAAFEQYDAPAIAACYITPCLFVRDGVTEALDSSDAVAESVHALLDLHRAWDVQTARPASVSTLETGPRHAVVRVDWRLGRRRSRVKWTFATTYTLVPADDDWQIAVAITHDAPF